MKQLSLLFFILTLSCSCIMSQEILSKKQFTEAYQKKAAELHPDIEYRIIEDLYLISIYKGLDYEHFLDNAYTEYKLEPKKLDRVIIKYVKASDDLYKPEKDIDINHIVPIIKDKNYVSDIKKSLAQKGNKIDDLYLVYQKYNDELIIVYAEDQKTSMKYFSKDDFAKTGFPFDSLLNKSVQNLKRILPEIQSIGDSGVYGLITGGYYEASLILIESLWTKENFNVKGEIVISTPTRDILFITGSYDKEGLDKVKKSTKEAYESGSYFLTKDFFVWTGNKFELFKKN